MKHAGIARLLIFAALALLLAGCAGSVFTIVSGGKHTTITANNAPDGATAESAWFSVGKGKTVSVASALEKGALKIDFAEAAVHGHEDEPDDVVVGTVIVSVTLGPGERSEFTLEKGEYVMLLAAVGTADGTVTVDIQSSGDPRRNGRN